MPNILPIYPTTLLISYPFAIYMRLIKVHAFATKPSGQGARKKRKSSDDTDVGSSEFDSEEDISHDRRPAKVHLSVEDAVSRYFTQEIDSPETKDRKLAMAEREIAMKQAEAVTMHGLLKSTHDSPNSKAKRLSIEEMNAKARMQEVLLKADELKAKAEETKAKVEETKASQSFMLSMAAIMGKLADKI